MLKRKLWLIFFSSAKAIFTLNTCTVHADQTDALCFSAHPGSHRGLSGHELLILHTADAYEWATYLRQILKSSRKFRKRPILLCAVADEGQGYDFEHFQRCRCILLLLTGELLDMLWDPELQSALRDLLYPPERVVVLLCGVLEDDVRKDCFEDWPSWKKLSAEDDPQVYISTITQAIADSTQNLLQLVAGLLVNKTFLELHNKTMLSRFVNQRSWGFVLKWDKYQSHSHHLGN